MLDVPENELKNSMVFTAQIKEIFSTLVRANKLPESVFVVAGDNGYGKTFLLSQLSNDPVNKHLECKVLDLSRCQSDKELYSNLYFNFTGQYLEEDVDPTEFLQCLEDAVPSEMCWLVMVDDLHLCSVDILNTLFKLLIVTNNQIKMLVTVEREFDFNYVLGQLWAVIENRKLEWCLSPLSKLEAKQFIKHLQESDVSSRELERAEILDLVDQAEGVPSSMVELLSLGMSHSRDHDSLGDVASNGNLDDNFDNGFDANLGNNADESYEEGNDEYSEYELEYDEEVDEEVDEEGVRAPEKADSGDESNGAWYTYIPFFHLLSAFLIGAVLLGLLSMDGPGSEKTRTDDIDLDLNSFKDQIVAPVLDEEVDLNVDENESSKIVDVAGLNTESKSKNGLSVEVPVPKQVEKIVIEKQTKYTSASPKRAPAAVAKNPSPGKVNWYPYQSDKWIGGLSPSYYTLQIMASHDAAGIQHFLKANGVSSKYAVYTTEKKGKAWHVVIYGVYETRDFADSARSSLPEYLKEFSPWIRSLADVQKSI